MSEGLNSQIQKIKCMACGFWNMESVKTTISFHCGRLDLYPCCTQSARFTKLPAQAVGYHKLMMSEISRGLKSTPWRIEMMHQTGRLTTREPSRQ
jgi:hypothetical protein